MTNDMLSQTKGGWKTMLALLSTAGAVGAFLTNWLHAK